MTAESALAFPVGQSTRHLAQVCLKRIDPPAPPTNARAPGEVDRSSSRRPRGALADDPAGRNWLRARALSPSSHVRRPEAPARPGRPESFRDCRFPPCESFARPERAAIPRFAFACESLRRHPHLRVGSLAPGARAPSAACAPCEVVPPRRHPSGSLASGASSLPGNARLSSRSGDSSSSARRPRSASPFSPAAADGDCCTIHFAK